MATSYYDDALIKKIKAWTEKTEITITSPDETKRLFESISDMNNDKPLKLPLICIRRKGGYNIINTSKQPLTFDGLRIDANINRSIQLNAVPIEIQYQIDVYTRYYKEADEYIRNFVFNIINFPKLTITIPYQSINLEHDSNIRLSSEVEDNSDIPERLIAGQFTRLSLNINNIDI